MARKIVWSDFIKEEAIFRYWYVLENNNFKSAIKQVQKEGRMNYANMHNALYSGLYYPEKEYLYPYRTITDLRAERNLPKGAALANFMDRHEILQNIHAMSDSARAIKKNAPYGYNAKLFAKEFNLIGKQESKLAEKAKIKTIKLYHARPSSSEEQVPNKPNRYNLAKNFVKKHIYQPYKPNFYLHPSTQKQALFNKALNKYQKAKQAFNQQATKKGLTGYSNTNLLHQFLNAGLYRTVLPHYGFDFEKVLNRKNQEHSKLITRNELLLHAKKFEYGTKIMAKSKTSSLSQLCEELRDAGIKVREAYIKKQRIYPECKIGFLNTFCEMISRKLELDPMLRKQAHDQEALTIADQLLNTVYKLKQQYEQSKSKADEKEIKKQLENIKKALEQSNEHNI